MHLTPLTSFTLLRKIVDYCPEKESDIVRLCCMYMCVVICAFHHFKLSDEHYLTGIPF